MARKQRRPIPRRRRRQRRTPPDSQQLAGIKQGVGRAVARAFGAPLRRRGTMAKFHPCMLDAFHQTHLTLPRPTGPYTVIRTTQIVDVADPLVIFGPIMAKDSQRLDRWTNILGFSFIDLGQSAATKDNIFNIVFESMKTTGWTAAQVVPSAFSVQVMNPESIQDTEGVVYAGRIRTAFKIQPNQTKAGATILNEFVSYNNPRLMSAAKLAFRGVQIDAVPLNMSELADFEVPYKVDAGKSEISSNTTSEFTGFTPIFIGNPKKIKLQYLVCCEWRVRFDPSNPAQASHVQHQHTSENIWMQVLNHAENVGNGVVDIADRVAQVGNAVFGASASTYRAARGMRALAGGMGALALGA